MFNADSFNRNSENNRSLGSLGEDLCAQFLEQKGYKIVQKNFRIRRGEIDLIALAPDRTLCFIEVKTDYSKQAGAPASWVTPAKQMQILKMAQAFLSFHSKEYENHNMRFDVCAIKMSLHLGPQIEYFENAFMPVIRY